MSKNSKKQKSIMSKQQSITSKNKTKQNKKQNKKVSCPKPEQVESVQPISPGRGRHAVHTDEHYHRRDRTDTVGPPPPANRVLKDPPQSVAQQHPHHDHRFLHGNQDAPDGRRRHLANVRRSLLCVFFFSFLHFSPRFFAPMFFLVL